MDPLMASGMSQHNHLMAQIVLRWHEDALIVEEEAIMSRPGCHKGGIEQLLLNAVGLRVSRSGGVDVINEAE